MRLPKDKPNIILMNCDDLGWGDLGCTGHRLHETPYLDRMAAEGMRFTDFYQVSPVCSPSRGGMLTGCYSQRIGFELFDGNHVLFPGQGMGLNPSEITFAKLAKEQGYATQIIGKWHCGDQPEFLPTNHGFDHYYGLPYSNDMGHQPYKGGKVPLPLMRDSEVIEEQPDQSSLTSRYMEEAVRFMRGHRDSPFLLYFAHMHVHLPLYVAARFEKESKNGRYGGAVACIDWSMGVIMNELKKLGLDNHTIILFTSDNGSRCDFGPSNGPLAGRKTTCWEGGLRVPFIARWPGQIEPGQVSKEMVTGMDIFPTIAGLIGAQIPNDRIIDGRDISPILLDPHYKETDPRPFFYYRKGNLAAVRYQNWKLHVCPIGWGDEPPQVGALFDLDTDISEKNDVSASHPNIVQKLQGFAEAARADLGDNFTNTQGTGCRPVGKVDHPKPLAEFDPNNPYYAAIYDLNEAG